MHWYLYQTIGQRTLFNFSLNSTIVGYCSFETLKEDPNNYILKAYKILTLNRAAHKNRMENMYLGYKAITSKKNGPLKGLDLFALIECLHVNYPGDITNLFIQVSHY